MPSYMGRVQSGRILLQVAIGPPGTLPTSDHLGIGLLDTGATMSGITPRLAEQAGLEYVST